MQQYAKTSSVVAVDRKIRHSIISRHGQTKHGELTVMGYPSMAAAARTIASSSGDARASAIVDQLSESGERRRKPLLTFQIVGNASCLCHTSDEAYPKQNVNNKNERLHFGFGRYTGNWRHRTQRSFKKCNKPARIALPKRRERTARRPLTARLRATDYHPVVPGYKAASEAVLACCGSETSAARGHIQS
ncbi:hypothetical protein NEOLEDRAFT_1170530 [Neolentinus lepideus HHB14362 ss-1]|uniref:Uncharacterized protein n=1 Tax=Neolentinus lepideus HHB14362 ss-1 TaxID=1314782 RepID=A0A165RHP2_9AGAM|nr:hypothetical protein NEOLEDRAFT_1170530 [Neolentinus lepideus HHB14362 ss-1]